MMVTNYDHENNVDDGDNGDNGDNGDSGADDDDNDNGDKGDSGDYKLFCEDDLVLLLPDLLDVRLPLPLDSWVGKAYRGLLTTLV